MNIFLRIAVAEDTSDINFSYGCIDKRNSSHLRAKTHQHHHTSWACCLIWKKTKNNNNKNQIPLNYCESADTDSWSTVKHECPTIKGNSGEII